MKNTKEDFLKQIKESQIKQQKVTKLINKFIELGFEFHFDNENKLDGKQTFSFIR
jgi:hypothetical protein